MPRSRDSAARMGTTRTLDCRQRDQLLGSATVAGYSRIVLDQLVVRRGGPEDIGVLVGLFDDAVAWLVACGQRGAVGQRAVLSAPRRAPTRERLGDWWRVMGC